jgi:NAD(P)-dependent dehydrogenase (short-subunit alcohol dehydrogenase family)
MMNHPFSLAGRHILVTGASSGIGKATALLLSELGARVIVTGRDEARLERTFSMLSEGRHSMSVFDLSATASISEWLSNLVAQQGRIDGIAHVAGVQIMRPLKIMTDEVLNTTMLTNVNTSMSLAQAFRLKTVNAEGGSLVFLSSVMGLVGHAGQAAYSASKAALIGMSRSLALELVRDKIRVNCVAPGLVNTEMASRLLDNLTDLQRNEVEKMHPMGLGKPEQIASVIAFLLSDASSWITGTTLAVDGGYTCH